MTRYTQKMFINDLALKNIHLAQMGSANFLDFYSENNNTFCALCFIDGLGHIRTQSTNGGPTPRTASTYADAQYSIYKRDAGKGELTREQALQILYIAGVDFNDDVHICSVYQKALLTNLAKRTQYRKPKTANHSTWVAFFKHMAKRAKKTPPHYMVRSLRGECA